MVRFADGPQASVDGFNEVHDREDVAPAAEVPRQMRRERPRVSRELRILLAGLVCGAAAYAFWQLLLS